MSDAETARIDPAQRARQRGFAGFASDMRKAWGTGPRGWMDLSRAAAELAWANLALRVVSAARLGLVDQAEVESTAGLSAEQAQLVERVAYAVPVMGNRVPWRSDCLVQAMAARRWLARAGIDSRIGLGARHAEDGAFMAHAWLKVGDCLVTGGDDAPFNEFVRISR